MEIYVYSLPYDSGHKWVRMGAGPAQLLDQGLAAQLQNLGHTVQTRVVEAPGGFPTEIQTSFSLYRELAGQIQQDCGAGGFPLILSGNCGAALGGISGLRGLSTNTPGVAWLDAHGDFNTPDTSPSGFLDGMGLATAAGLGWRSLARSIPGFRPLQPGEILHIGGRDFDQEEEQLLNEQGVALVSPGEIRKRGVTDCMLPVVDALAGQVQELYLHVDADVLDPLETPANHFPAPGGLTPEEVLQVIAELSERLHIRALGVASYDPDWDPAGKTAKALSAIIAAVVSAAAE